MEWKIVKRLIDAVRAPLLRESDLFHKVLVVPEQPLVVHRLAFPVPNGGHADSEAFSVRAIVLPSPRAIKAAAIKVLRKVVVMIRSFSIKVVLSAPEPFRHLMDAFNQLRAGK